MNEGEKPRIQSERQSKKRTPLGEDDHQATINKKKQINKENKDGIYKI